jgi:hypothetical protein
MSTLQSVTADSCGQNPQYWNAGNGSSKLLTRHTTTANNRVQWYDDQNKEVLLFSDFDQAEHTLGLLWIKNPWYTSVNVQFTNGDFANYYSKDNKNCDVTINNPAADVDKVYVLK